MTAAEIAGAVARQLQDAWNAADGAAYGKPFAPDADFVTIRGELHSGRAIAAGHQAIFDTIYRGSTVSNRVLDARSTTGDVIVAHVEAQLHVPAGPLAGDNTALGTMVLADEGDGHRIIAYHNTLVAQ
jgi:uncharacterized protein (TIGR02246 family)